MNSRCTKSRILLSHWGPIWSECKIIINTLEWYPFHAKGGPGDAGLGGGDLDFKWQGWPNGAKYQNPKKSHAKFLSLKISRKENKFGWTLNAELRGRDTREEPRIFRLYRQNSPNNPYLYQAINKNPGIEDFKPPKILRSSLSLEIRSNHPRERGLILITVQGALSGARFVVWWNPLQEMPKCF